MSYRMRREEFDQQFILKFHDLVMRMVNLSIIPNIEAIKRGFGFTVYDGSELLKWVDMEIDSQLQSVFEEIEEISGDRDLVTDFRDLPAFHKVGANLDKMRLLAAVSNSKHKRFVERLGSIRQKWLGKEEEK